LALESGSVAVCVDDLDVFVAEVPNDGAFARDKAVHFFLLGIAKDLLL